MEYLIILVLILLATALMVGVGDRFNLPWPVLLTLLATLIIVVPGLPSPEIEPEILLPIFLPPLLWAIGHRTSWGSLRREWRSILMYSIALTAVSAFVVAGFTWALIPSMGFAVALAVGAAIAPPDPVAVEAVAEPVGIPRRIVSKLQTEGIFNDAVSLVLFQAAILAVEGERDLAAGVVISSFIFSAVVAVLLGLAVGWIGSKVRRMMHDTVARSTVTLVIPFAVYILAEELHASGVIAVVIAAIQVGSSVGDLTAEDRLTDNAFWRVLELTVTGLAFSLIGLQAGEIVYHTEIDLWATVGAGVLISVVTILTRLIWMSLIWLIGRFRKDKLATPHSFAEVLVMTWSGMRGLVTLVLALPLPLSLGELRAEAIIMVVTVLFFTMVFPGLTLPTLVKVLGVGMQGNHAEAEEKELLAIAQKASLLALKESAASSDPEEVERVQKLLEQISTRYKKMQEADTQAIELRNEKLEKINRVRRRSLLAAQSAVIDQRNYYEYETVHKVLNQLDMMIQLEEGRDTGMTMNMSRVALDATKSQPTLKETMTEEQNLLTKQMDIVTAQKSLDGEYSSLRA